MTKDEAVLLMATLSERVGVKAPRLVWSTRSKNGRYKAGVVVVGPRAWRGVHDCILHELAHHVAWVYQLREGWTRRGQGPHGPRFRRALLDVVAADGWNYAWESEYRALRGLGESGK